MLINLAQEEECRIAIVANKQLDELYIERMTSTSLVGNIYKGKVVNVEPSIQACFIDFGIGQNGFMHISDIQSSYFKDKSGKKERVGKKRPRRQRPPIQDCIKRGQEVIVQVIKGGIGTKGPTLSTYLSIPGRYLVLMPGMNRTGISRKIEDDEERNKLKELLNQLDPPKEVGIILRTAALSSNKRDLRRDLNYLLRLWKTISNNIKKHEAPALMYQESDLVTRTIRDVYNTGIDRIICDSETTYKRVREFMAIALPRSRKKVVRYDGNVPMFTKYNLETAIDQIHRRHVPLKSGGSIVIDQTEALVAIDANSGRYRAHENAETTAYKINQEAAAEISRQLRLRDLGGVVIIDFIDMMQDKHRRSIEKTLRDAVASDRASTKILRISQFGIVEMTRQRIKPSLKSSIFNDCPYCQGAGLVKSPESVSIEIMRRIQYAIENTKIAQIEVNVSREVANYLQNRKRTALTELEQKFKKSIAVQCHSEFSNDQLEFNAKDTRGIEVVLKG